MVTIFFNGHPLCLTAKSSLAEVIDQANAIFPFAVTVNGQFVPRGDYTNTLLQWHDRVELVQPITGG